MTNSLQPNPLKYIDLFCGIGGFRLAIEQICSEQVIPSQCVLSSDIDAECQKAYAANFGETPLGDIQQLSASNIPAHDILLGGFPCQPFSICGDMKGFADTRGTLFFDIARILEAKRPAAFVLENVKLLVGHNQGRTLKKIVQTLEELGYQTHYKVLNALDFGLPQKRERIFIVGFKDKNYRFEWPLPSLFRKPLEKIIERNVPAKFFASEKIRQSRFSKMSPTQEITIWHENKSGHISAYPFSCALRAGASYNYLLVNGERRLTEREMLRLQGFPDHFRIVCNYQQTRKQAGNSVAVPVVEAVLRSVFSSLQWGHQQTVDRLPQIKQKRLLFEEATP